METRTKVIMALCFAAIIICNSCVIMGALGVQRAFAEAAPGTYTMTNIIYINATGLGRMTPEILRIAITEEPKDTIWTKDGLVENKGIDDAAFEPNSTLELSGIVDVYERQTIKNGIMSIQGIPINATNAQIGLGFTFNDEFIPINSTDFYEAGFDHAAISFPAVEKSLLFKSPAHYANEFCAENGYVLRNIVNSTYSREYDMNTLNLFYSKIIKEDFVIINYNNTDNETLGRNFDQYGGSLRDSESKPFPVALVILGIVIIVLGIFVATPIIQTLINDQYALEGLKLLNRENSDKLTESLNTTKWLTDHMLADKEAERQLLLEMYANNSISWEQLQYLLLQNDASYNPLINNCTVNIPAMLSAYYNTTADLYGTYTNGLASFSSWTNWIYDLIILIVVMFAIYMVYSLITKFKSTNAPTRSIIIT